MAVAVVGASGFLGRALVAALNRAGTPVSAYTRSVPFLTPGGRPEAGLASARTVYWLATQINPQSAEQDPGKVVADRAAFEKFLQTLRGVEPAPTIVLLSSGGTVYDPATDPPYAESARTRPLSAYGRAKVALEGLLAERAPGRHVALRVSNAYGPGQPTASGQGVVAHWLRAAGRGEDIRVFGDPATTRDYVYVNDIADALVAVDGLDVELPPAVNIGSGRPTSLGELAETVLDVVAAQGLRVIIEQRRSFDVSQTWLDVTLAGEILRWQPATSLRDGIGAAWAAAQGRR